MILLFSFIVTYYTEQQCFYLFQLLLPNIIRFNQSNNSVFKYQCYLYIFPIKLYIEKRPIPNNDII